MSIWHKDYDLAFMNDRAAEDNILRHLGIRFTELGPDFVRGVMPVDTRTRQPYGILHGGATCVLAETLGSFASLMCIDLDSKFAVGSVITTNHLRPVEDGLITGTCCPVHVGRTKHVWQIDIHDEKTRLIARSELTCAVTDKK